MNIVLAAATLIIAIAAVQFTNPPTQSRLSGPKSESEVSSPVETENSITVSQSIRTKNFWLLWIIATLQGSAGISMVTLSVVFGLSRGFALESAAILLMAFNLGNGLGRFLMGYLSDILGPKLTMSLAFLAASAAYFCLPHISILFFMALATGFVGTAFGTLMTVSPPLTTECFGISHFGAIYGLVLTGHSFLGGIIGPALSGHLLDITNENFSIVFTYLGVFCGLAGSLIWWVVPPKR
jgi:OFA family oxalate/formate antiporter-like MFS transporter